MQLRRILIGTDFSEPSVAAAKWTVHHFLGDGDVEIVLAHTVHIPEPPRFLRARFAAADTVLETARIGAEERLRGLAAALDAGRGRISTRVGEGRAAEQLAELAKELDADIIVVGKHGQRGVAPRLGSTAERLAGLSPVPVLLVTGMRDVRPRRLLVALDDADVTPSVLSWARFLGARFDARVTAIHVVSSAVLSHVLSTAAVTTGKERFEEQDVREEFREETDRWIARLVAAGLERAKVTSEVAFGEPGQEVLAAAEREGAELIVIGRRGAGRVRRAIMGSVSAEVLRHAVCPVLVVAEPEDEIVATPATAMEPALARRPSVTTR